MTKRYILAAIVAGTAYPFGRQIIVQQEPSGVMTVSTLTLNYILLFVLAGAVSPWLASRIPVLRRFKKSVASGIVMLTLVSSLLVALALIGMPMRWSQ